MSMVIPGLTAAFVAGGLAKFATPIIAQAIVLRLDEEIKAHHGCKQSLLDARGHFAKGLGCLKEHEARTTETRV